MNEQFHRAICGLFGIVYLIFALCMINYGARLSIILSNLQDSTNIGHIQDENLLLLKALNKRVRIKTIFAIN